MVVSTSVTVEEAKGRLQQLLELAARGHEIIIHDPTAGRAKQVPVPETYSRAPRVLGLHKGQVRMSDDFDAPLPDSFWFGEAQE